MTTITIKEPELTTTDESLINRALDLQMVKAHTYWQTSPEWQAADDELRVIRELLGRPYMHTFRTGELSGNAR